jgi:hypothetical protein
LVNAVKRFQTRHGLDPDGRIGKTTLAQLNTPLSHRIRQLKLTLERWRWVPHEFDRPPIVVNIPEFRLRAFNSSYSCRPVGRPHQFARQYEYDTGAAETRDLRIPWFAPGEKSICR